MLESEPAWFVMENVPQAPCPAVAGYGVKSFLLDNSALAGEGGFGLEQRRLRRFSFGMRGLDNADVPSLLRWIDLAVFLLADAQPNNGIHGNGATPSQRVRSGPVTAAHDSLENVSEWSRRKRYKAVSGSSGCAGAKKITPGAGNAGKGRYRLANAIHLQGLPEGFLDDAPFTAKGKLRAVANGVPLPMGRAIAKAIKEALKSGIDKHEI